MRYTFNRFTTYRTNGTRLQADLEFKKKQQEDAKARKELAAKAAKGGPLVGGGIKKSRTCPSPQEADICRSGKK